MFKKTGIISLHETTKFGLVNQNGEKFSYKPDFILGLEINGKIPVLEVHGHSVFQTKDFHKYSEFRRAYGDRFYSILASDLSPVQLNLLANAAGHDAVELADEIWYLLDLDNIGPDNSIRGDGLWTEWGENVSGYVTGKLETLKSKSVPLASRKFA